MDTFYKIVLIVATVMLLLILVAIGTLIQQDGSTVYPPNALKCPDYWVDDSEGCRSQKINDASLNSPIDFEDETKDNYYKTLDSNPDKYIGLSDTCSKRKWALSNNILWDGISNYNSC